jgi:HK97 family phage prohead protease
MSERFLGSVQGLGDREVGIICATDQLARDGHVLIPQGIDLAAYKSNPIVLWSHQPEQPVGACTAIAVENGALAARVQFAPAGASAISDEICALVKANVVRGVSIGFNPVEAEPLDPAQGSRGGLRITAAELLEISFVAIPADTGAKVVARSIASLPGAAALLRALPAVAPGAIERAFSQLARARDQRPSYLLSPREQFEAERARCMTTWALGQAEREREKQSSYEQRQADLRALSGESTH